MGSQGPAWSAGGGEGFLDAGRAAVTASCSRSRSRLDRAARHATIPRPQLTEPASLKSFVFQKGVRGDSSSSGGGALASARQAQNATLTVTGAVSWRREGIRYKNNEVFLDIVEEVNLLMGTGGAARGARLNGPRSSAGEWPRGCISLQPETATAANRHRPRPGERSRSPPLPPLQPSHPPAPQARCCAATWWGVS
jgi:hypothetical protein